MAITPSALALKTIADSYLKGASDLTIRRRLLFALLQSKGRVMGNADAFTTKWLVYYKEPSVRDGGPGTEQTFNGHDGYKQLSIGLTSHYSTSTLDHMTYQINQASPGQIINLFQDQMLRLTQAIQHDLARQVYLSGSGQDWGGFGTALGYNTCATTDKVASPNGSYGGADTDLADQGGTWSSDLPAASRPNATLANDWPYGTGSSEYDYIAPKFFNTNCTNWRSGVATFRDNTHEIMSFANGRLRTLTGDDEATNLFCMSGDHYSDFQNSQLAQQRIMMPHQEALKLGFNEVYNFEGAMVNSDIQCPAGRTYVINYEQVEIFHVSNQLIQAHTPDFSLTADAYLFKQYHYSNMRYNPKFVGYIGDWTV